MIPFLNRQKAKLMSRRLCLNLWLFRSAPPVTSVKQVAANPQIPAASTLSKAPNVL